MFPVRNLVISNNSSFKNESFLNSMSDDISSIKNIVDRTISIDIYKFIV